MADKKSFILYTEYQEQINMMTDEQAGQLMKAIFAYESGQEVNVTDQVVMMLWSIMKRRLDIDNEKYDKKCEANQENGKKGGRPPKNKSDGIVKKANGKNQNPKKPNGFEENPKNLDTCNMIHDTENDIDMSSSSDDYEDINNSACACSRHGSDESATVPFGKDGCPTTQAEIAKFETLTAKLCMAYKQKPPNKTDKDKVFAYVYTRIELPNGEAIAAFDQQKAALLEYAFEQAAAADRVNWRYIDGIYSNWERDGIDTMQKLEEHEFKRQHGISTDDFMQKFYGG